MPILSGIHIFAGISARFVHALSTSHTYRRYRRLVCTCAFPLLPLSAGTDAWFIHASFRFSHFPQVPSLGLYMRLSTSRAFRRYSRSIYTCTFPFLPLSAGTLARFIPALFRFSHFPQVFSLDLYLHFSVSSLSPDIILGTPLLLRKASLPNFTYMNLHRNLSAPLLIQIPTILTMAQATSPQIGLTGQRSVL